MLDDLTRNYKLVGMSANEVKTLLGVYSIRREAFSIDEGRVDYYWGYIVRYDDWNGMEVLLLGLKGDMVVNYERTYLNEL